MNCTPISNLKKISCSVQQRTITIVFEQFLNPDGAFTWEIDNIRNPSSTKTSKPFESVKFSDKDGYTISVLSTQVADITNKYPA